MTTTTTTQHRPGCPRPGWTVEQSRTRLAIAIARCDQCGAVELRTEPDPDRPTTPIKET